MLFLVLLLIPNLAFADWECNKKIFAKAVEQHSINTDYVIAKELADKYGEKVIPIEDADGGISYMVNYKVVVVGDTLFDEDAHCELR